MKLDETEKEICCRIAVNGETVEQVALAMHCHKNTILNYLKVIKKRFECVSLPQLMAKLTNMGLLNE